MSEDRFVGLDQNKLSMSYSFKRVMSEDRFVGLDQNNHKAPTTTTSTTTTKSKNLIQYSLYLVRTQLPVKVRPMTIRTKTTNNIMTVPPPKISLKVWTLYANK
jgi:hypothetical protein